MRIQSIQEEPRPAVFYSCLIAKMAVTALVDEAVLTPKPGLVDAATTGSHQDMNIETLLTSAYALQPTFLQIALYSQGKQPSQMLREEIARIGREGEQIMYGATDGVNTHKGAIWALGLLASATAVCGIQASPASITEAAGKIARYADRFCPLHSSNGLRVKKQYGAKGAAGEAKQGFPHVIHIGLPALHKARKLGIHETSARIDTLVTLIANLDDTCILHRAGPVVLKEVKMAASNVLEAGGVSTSMGKQRLKALDHILLSSNASPGGSADLLAAVLFLDRISLFKES
ncbi:MULTISPECIES: triphosphoribosyl-dephospho-CoA synthase [Priestia]|jgi:triphosphoribosyl-dephospho-CoA synthase|uniref:triphosphoribosyl-dephospho-CoA synthase n=1 Tax=Priestia megaterium (strain DSM 319 / IMG 1521) TaxID=592022 RepID=D5DB09_PRIM3|nr:MULTISPECIES: triphosphoribosyl-dephospho-CoA synthase [Priestia]ADF37660.1 triphosphoribosyl-dephospho-CoA synthase MdcB [Priestia megaterium DSM 319]MDC0704146.1 triphosphoribosyl-dephospho-CoA synthase [Priestia sp. AB]MED3941175.1 triphosphoribosyl-dephospho-CoA synthase [Priestia megaterium]MED4207899.1 triphosphoribosyl-dephospho-CoA synthase [Priestia megaterium]MED4217576.1 triphosphoribosyl-dephospho-CoA synthase [Priestia megaterium]